MPEPHDELTAEQAMELLGVSRTTLYALVKRALVIKHIKPFGKGQGARRTFFLRSELDALMQREAEPPRKKKAR